MPPCRSFRPRTAPPSSGTSNFCRNLQIQSEVIESPEPAKAVAAYARAHGITQIFVTRDAPDVPQAGPSGARHAGHDRGRTRPPRHLAGPGISACRRVSPGAELIQPRRPPLLQFGRSAFSIRRSQLMHAELRVAPAHLHHAVPEEPAVFVLFAYPADVRPRSLSRRNRCLPAACAAFRAHARR